VNDHAFDRALPNRSDSVTIVSDTRGQRCARHADRRRSIRAQWLPWSEAVSSKSNPTDRGRRPILQSIFSFCMIHMRTEFELKAV